MHVVDDVHDIDTLPPQLPFHRHQVASSPFSARTLITAKPLHWEHLRPGCTAGESQFGEIVALVRRGRQEERSAADPGRARRSLLPGSVRRARQTMGSCVLAAFRKTFGFLPNRCREAATKTPELNGRALNEPPRRQATALFGRGVEFTRRLLSVNCRASHVHRAVEQTGRRRSGCARSIGVVYTHWKNFQISVERPTQRNRIGVGNEGECRRSESASK